MNGFKENRNTLLWATLGAIVTNLVFNPYCFESFKHFAIGLIWSWVVWTTQWFGNAYLGDWLDEKISWIEKPLPRAVAGIVGLIFYSILAFSIVHVIMNWLIFDTPVIESLKWLGIHSLKYAIIISGAISLVLNTIAFFKNWKESKIEAEKLRAEMMTYKYEALRNQINPHFLFNSFNVLSELVYEDQGLAVKFIKQLSDVYRYVLDSKDRELISLQEEVDFIKIFGSLLQTRFENNLTIDIQIEPAKDELIVPMSLQLLLENAVKHNEVSSQFPLHIDIKRMDHSIQVKNLVKKKKIRESGTKTGLQNIMKRYKFLSDRQVRIEEKDNDFIVTVPILKSEKS
jgi:sensor histidine kinase YesM